MRKKVWAVYTESDSWIRADRVSQQQVTVSFSIHLTYVYVKFLLESCTGRAWKFETKNGPGQAGPHPQQAGLGRHWTARHLFTHGQF